MPRRCNDVIQPPETPKKKTKSVVEESPSLDISFCDDDALPPGIILTDVQQKKWRIGTPIGRGGFGRIYLVSDDVNKEVTKSNARYVAKVEPHSNGTLFVEMYCLIRTAQVSKIKEWRKENNKRRLGMPAYVASGSFINESTGTKYRFLLLPRYDIDLQKIIARTRTLDLKNVLVLSLQILEVLEYLHNQGYTHSDIKSSNLMLGIDTKFLNKPVVKLLPCFQKETKKVTVLSGKHRRAKSGKTRSSKYYNDEDYTLKDPKSDIVKRLENVKTEFSKFLAERDTTRIFRHHAFNLRQLTTYVNYEDLSSSVCSDQSYQKLLDDFGSRNFVRTSEELLSDKINKKKTNKLVDQSKDKNLDEIYNEAILSQSNGQIYLLDYGLASKFVDSDGIHKNLAMDARKAHDGTLEYSSRDSHIGAHSRRSDLETLGYNILDWLTATLPWKTKETLEPDLVHMLKKNFMNDIKSLLKTCFRTEFYPQFLEKYLEYVASLDFTEKPDYDYCRSLFRSELKKNGYNCDRDILLNFDPQSISVTNRKLCYSRIGVKNTSSDFLARNGIKKSYQREKVGSRENNSKLELLRPNSNSFISRKHCKSRIFFVSDSDLFARLRKSLIPNDIVKTFSPKNLRSNMKTVQKRKGKKSHKNSIGKFGKFMGSARQFTWAEILAGNPEVLLRKDRAIVTDDNNDDTSKYRIRKLSSASSYSSESHFQSPLMQKDYLQGRNPTYAMKECLATAKKKTSTKNKDSSNSSHDLKGYTPEMIKYHRIKEKREVKEKQEALKQYNLDKQEVVQDNTKMALRSKSVTKERSKSKAKDKIAAKKEDKNVDKPKTRKNIETLKTLKNNKNQKIKKNLEKSKSLKNTEILKSLKNIEKLKSSEKLNTLKNIDKPKTPKNIEKPKTPKNIEKPKTPKNVEQPKTLKYIEKLKTRKNVEKPKTLKKVEKPKTLKNVEKLKTLRNIETLKTPEKISKKLPRSRSPKMCTSRMVLRSKKHK